MNRRLCLATCFTILGFATSPTAVLADVVFGNLGNSGTGNLSNTATDIFATAVEEGQVSGLAQGFTTGTSSDFLTLESVVLGLFSEAGNRTVGLYNNSGGLPGTLVATSSAVNVTAQNRYTFNFSSVPLSANTTYWIVPQVDTSWYYAAAGAFATPSGRNSSGYTYASTAIKTFESGNAWTTTGAASGYSISVTAVPEPSTYAMAAIGAGLLGLARCRRRQAVRLAEIR